MATLDDPGHGTSTQRRQRHLDPFVAAVVVGGAHPAVVKAESMVLVGVVEAAGTSFGSQIKLSAKAEKK